MTNAPGSRTTHVVRLLGTSRSGDVVDSIWVDVERIDELIIRTQTTNPPNQWQEISIRPKWRDDPNVDGYEPEDVETTASSRNHKILKISDPTAGNFDDPDEWVPIKVIKHVDFADSGKQRQKRFATDRDVTTRRIHHYDTSIDDAAQTAFDAGQKAFVIDGASYFQNDNSKDDSQYIEHEIIWSYDRTDNRYHKSNGRDLDVQVRLNNQYLIDDSAEAKLEETGPDGVNPPYRLDPFQNIINVQWAGGAVFVVATRGGSVYFGEIKRDDAGKSTIKFETATIPDAPVIHGSAYGLVGQTKEKKGTPVFVICGEDGSLHTSNDGLTWHKTYTAPEESRSEGDETIVYIKSNIAIVWKSETKKFVCYQFVNTRHTEINQNIARLLSSSDGESWTASDQPVIDVEGSSYSDFPDAYCAHNDCRDYLGNNVPDGVSCHDDKKKILMRPEEPPAVLYGHGQVDFVGFDHLVRDVNRIDIVTAETSVSKTMPGMIWTFCVAGLDKVWLAGGHKSYSDQRGAAAVSFDAGETWSAVEQIFGVFAGANWISTISVAPASDIRKSTSGK